MTPEQLTNFRAEIMQELKYEPETGLLRWRQNRRGVKAGNIAGYKSKLGYIQIGFKGSLWLAHQLAWLFVHGVAHAEIDHIDCNPSNNKFNNLRKATHAQNNWNKGFRSNNTSGHRGVARCGNKWRAYITVNKSGQIHLGRFAKKEDAIAARLEAEKRYFGEYAYAG